MYNDEAGIIKDNVWKPHNKTLSTQQMMMNMEIEIRNLKIDAQAKF